MARYNGIPACGTKYADGKVTTGAALLVTSPQVQEEILFFRTHKRAGFPTYEYNDLFIKSVKCYSYCLSRLHTQ